MNKVKKIQIAKYICYFTRLFLLVFSIFWMFFAILSGAERIGGGKMISIPIIIFGIIFLISWHLSRIKLHH